MGWYVGSVCMQAYELNTLLLTTMRVGLPLVATTYFLHPKKKVMAICGDGGFMLHS